MSKKTIIALISYLLFSLIYIHPGELPFFEKSTTQVLSDGTDPVTFPYQFSFLINRFKEKPTDFLYGAVFNPYQDAPDGLPLWIPAIERIEILFLSLFIPVEQISTGLVIIGMTLNGLFMFLLARALSIPTLISWGMGAAWAFNAYTRARAKVHMGLVGTYHLPLIFLSIILLGKDERKSKILGTLGFLLISFMPYYYVVTLAALTPLILLFVWIKRPARENQKKYFLTITAAALPAILWLTWSILNPLPKDIIRTSSPFPQTSEYVGPYHPFLDYFAASPIDYFTGDIGIGTTDLNYFKENLNNKIVLEKFHGSNPHESAQGIRWLIWILAAIGIISLIIKTTVFRDKNDQKLVCFFTFFAVISFCLSMPPNWPIDGFSASLWLHKVISHIRVPNRAGIGTAISLIVISGLFLKNILRSELLNVRTKRLIGISFAIIIIFELPPFLLNMPISQIQPAFTNLTEEKSCGIGFSYPYVSAQNNGIAFYYLLQRLRGSNCQIINSSVLSDLDTKMMRHFSESTIINEQRTLEQEFVHLKSFTECSGVSWITFNQMIRTEVATKLCNDLSWKMDREKTCISPNIIKRNQNINNCLN